MRTLRVALLVVAALAALAGGWIVTGWRAVAAETAALERAPLERAARRAAELASALGGRLEELRAREGERPYFHYQNLYHDPRGASVGAAVAPSPLAAGPGDPLIATHFQIDAGGAVTVPTLNEELPELSDPGRVRASRAALAELTRAAAALGPDAAAGAVAAGAPPVAAAPQADEVQAFDPDVYAQNSAPNAVFRQVQEHKQGAAPAPPGPGGRAGIVEIRVSPLRWRSVVLGAAPRLVALRTIETPDGTLGQGFVIAPEEVARLLAAGGVGLAATLGPGAAAGGLAAALPIVGAPWHVAVDPGAEVAAAAIAAAAVRRRFVVELVPLLGLAIACGGLVVLAVARAERLAGERSRFAAAAAHELRTPLAGLALYGEMLADGLGDPARARDYARRIADEATRLGRVVGNVLGFTQLERGVLAVAVRGGDVAPVVAEAAERARPALEHAGVALAVDLGAPLPARFDAEAVARIVFNLVDNAEKYGRGQAPVIRVSGRRGPAGVEIAVADDGPGVAPHLRRRLFRPFVRGGHGDAPAGLGLGLALSRALAQAMGGSLVHRDRPGGGAVFVLALPSDPAADRVS